MKIHVESNKDCLDMMDIFEPSTDNLRSQIFKVRGQVSIKCREANYG